MKTTNSIKHTIRKKFKNVTIHGHKYALVTAKAVIRLNDECNNGHNGFAITGSIWEGDICTDRTSITSGACGDTLAKLMPELQIFEDLHLCDVKGNPMHAAANGFYHLKNEKPEKAIDYCHLTPEEFEHVRIAEDQDHYQYLLESSGALKRWKNKAKEAIKILEEWTGLKFKDDSKRFQLTPLPNAKKKEIKKRIESGYYTPDQIQKRADKKKADHLAKALQKLEDDFKDTCWKEEKQMRVKQAVLLAGLPLGNFIFYTHKDTGVFNWNDSHYSQKENITAEQFAAFEKSKHRLSIGFPCTFEIKNIKPEPGQ